MRRLSVHLLTWCAAALALGAQPAHAIPAADAVARINALRVANGIPAVAEDPLLSAGCQAHARYMALNGGYDAGNPHDETPGRLGYTFAGAQAARHSVLAGPGGWSDPHPWATAPYHRVQIMDPALTRTGYGEHDGWMCLQTLTEPRRAVAGEIYTYPGPGAIHIPPTERASEVDASGASHVPGDDVGLPAGTETGPNLIVFAYAAGSVDFPAARLTGPRGPVPVAGSAPFLIPLEPLDPGALYVAEVDVRYGETTCIRQGAPSAGPDGGDCPAGIAPWCYRPFREIWPPPLRVCAPGEAAPAGETVRLPAWTRTHRWEFTTADGLPPLPCRPQLSAPARIARRTLLTLRLRTCAAASVTATVYRGSRRVLVRRARARTPLRLSTRGLPPGRYRLYVIVGGLRITRTFTVAV